MKKQIVLSVVAAVLFLCGLALMLFVAPGRAGRSEDTTPTTPTSVQQDTTAAEEPTTTDGPVETDPPETVPPAETTPPEEKGLTASHAFVFDCAEGRYLYIGGSENEQVAPASLTKLMTAYVALQYLPEDQVVTVGQEVRWIAANSSVAWLAPGHKLTVRMLIQGLIMQSGNDAAYTLAVAGGRAIGDDTGMDAKKAYDLFVEEMNATAREMGLTGTHFENPDGIDENGHYSTVADLVKLSLTVMEDECIMEFASTQKAKVWFESGENCTWVNSNLLLDPSSSFYCAQAVGLKTGSTSRAGKCLISLFATDDGYLLVGVLGCPEDRDRYADTLKLYNEYK